MCCSATNNIWHMLPTATKLPTLRPYTRASTCSRHNRAARVSLRCHNYPKIPTLSRSPMEVVTPAANGRPEYTRQAPLTCLGTTLCRHSGTLLDERSRDWPWTGSAIPPPFIHESKAQDRAARKTCVSYH